MDWRLIVDPPAAGSWNMALDEALLEAAGRAGQGGCLRFYAWREPTLSLGYFQRAEDRQWHLASRACAVVRRATGGGALIHDAELTYSVTMPVARHVDADLRSWYDVFHTTLVETLAGFGVAARLAPGTPCEPGRAPPFLCFQRRCAGDVLVGQGKIGGSAQRRHRGALLQHGSVLLRASPAAPELPGIQELSGRVIAAGELVTAWSERLVQRLGVRLHPTAATAHELGAAARYERERFLNPQWTHRK